MSESLVVKLDDELHFVGWATRRTSGLAHQLALRVTDDGFRARVIDDPDEVDEVKRLCEQIEEQRTNGFIKEYGHIPNGDRTRGEGARTIGRMIYPPFGVRLESVAETMIPAETPGNPSPPSLTLSSTNSENQPKKSYEISTKKFRIIIGGKQ